MDDQQPDPLATSTTRKRFQRIAAIYDLMESLPDWSYWIFQKRIVSKLEGLTY